MGQVSWQQFRGNYRNGSSAETNINEKWTENEPELVLRKNIGSGYSEIIISTDKVIVMSCEKIDSLSGSEFMIAYDAKTNKELWKTAIDSMYRDSEGNWGEGPRSTPAIDDKAIYCLSSYGKLRAISMEDGKILWTVNLLKEFDNKPGWIYTSSPIQYENELIIELGGTESRGFASFDKSTGKKRWVNGEGRRSYCSPTIAEIDGGIHMIFANGSKLKSFSKTGDELWSYSMPLQGANATPLFIAPNKIFVSSKAGCFMIKVENNGVTEVFNNKSMRNEFSTSCYYNGHIYGISTGALKCISETDGESKWKQRGFGRGSLIRVGNKLLVISDKGVLKLVEATPETYIEKGSIQAINGRIMTAPSFANGIIYLRNLTEMVAFKIN
ncbi:MAG: PQQ-like beta-propeller repeat protein [Salinivirgaceae bacterium]|nr:PQQ-like beta-propeller repeat protein [Salinivirgaceae bacterium]